MAARSRRCTHSQGPGRPVSLGVRSSHSDQDRGDPRDLPDRDVHLAASGPAVSEFDPRDYFAPVHRKDRSRGTAWPAGGCWNIRIYLPALEASGFWSREPCSTEPKASYGSRPETKARRYAATHNLTGMVSLDWAREPIHDTAKLNVRNFVKALRRKHGRAFPHLYALSRGNSGEERLHAHLLVGDAFTTADLRDFVERHWRYGVHPDIRNYRGGFLAARERADYVMGQRVLDLPPGENSYTPARGFMPKPDICEVVGLMSEAEQLIDSMLPGRKVWAWSYEHLDYVGHPWVWSAVVGPP